MSIFPWFKRPKEGMYPFGLDPTELELLEDLTERAGWPIFQRLLRDIAELRGSYLLGTTDPAAIHEARGFIKAIRHTVNLIDQIREAAKKIDHERTRTREAERESESARSIVGSPWRRFTSAGIN